jgi:hypothetical protein
VDLTLELGHDIRNAFGERIDLSLAQILTRDKNMLVKRHGCASFDLADRWFRANRETPPAVVRLCQLVQSKRGEWHVASPRMSAPIQIRG